MNVERPVIVVGTGRCGSTMLHRVLALHEDLGWLSPYNEVLPTQAWVSRLSNLYRSTGLSRKTRHLEAFPKPFEAYRFWEHYLPGFSRRDKPQTAADVPRAAIPRVHAILSRVLRHQGRPRLLVKVTGWARVAYFNEIFPDAVFVWLNREHRSVVSSWIQAGWLDVTSAPDSKSWQWGPVPDAYLELWRELGGDRILSAALKIQLDLDDIRRNLAHFPARHHTLQYAQLIGSPHQSLQALLEFCGLPWSEAFQRTLDTLHFYDSSSKWRQYLSSEDADRVVDFFTRADEVGLAGSFSHA